MGRNYWFPWRSLLIWYVAIAQSSRAANCLPSRARPRKLNTYSSSASTHLPRCSGPPVRCRSTPASRITAQRPCRGYRPLDADVADAASLRLCLRLPRGRPPSGRAPSSSSFVATIGHVPCESPLLLEDGEVPCTRSPADGRLAKLLLDPWRGCRHVHCILI